MESGLLLSARLPGALSGSGWCFDACWFLSVFQQSMNWGSEFTKCGNGDPMFPDMLCICNGCYAWGIGGKAYHGRNHFVQLPGRNWNMLLVSKEGYRREVWAPEREQIQDGKAQICSFYGWIILHCIYVPHLYQFISRWASRLLPCSGYCK